MHTKLKISLIFWMLGISLTGCSTATSVWVLDEEEIQPLATGETFTAPCNGTFYSDRAERRVMNARRIKQDLR